MVSVDGSTDARKSEFGTECAGVLQPEVSTALQRPTVITDTRFSPPTLTRYAVVVPGSSVMVFGNAVYPGLWFDPASALGDVFEQPVVTVPWQVRVLIADSVSSFWLRSKTECNDSSTATDADPAPAVTAGGVLAQPEVIAALQRAPSMTETVPSL